MCSVIAVPFVSARQQCSFISLAAHGDHYIPCKCFCYFVSTSDIDCPSGSAVRVMSGLSSSFWASANFFFYSKFHWKSWTEIFFLVSVTKGSSFFPNPLRAVSLWCSLLCIFFLCSCPQALQWKLKIPRATQGFFSISFSESFHPTLPPPLPPHFCYILTLTSGSLLFLLLSSTRAPLWSCGYPSSWSASSKRCFPPAVLRCACLSWACCAVPSGGKAGTSANRWEFGSLMPSTPVYFDRVNGQLRHVLASH